ncbi:MAG: efflux RND transporter permease subunit, partial [Gemmataceae bacterium]
MWLVREALKNPYLVSVIALLFVVGGLVSVTQIPVDILPAFKSPGVIVMTFYTGMPASSVDRTITSRIERWCGQAGGVTRIESKSVTGISVVKLFFRDDVDPSAALAEVNSRALNTLRTLPPGTLPPLVLPFDPTATLPLCILSVSAPKGDLTESQLQDFARINIRNQLGGLNGVVAPTAFGGRERAVMIYVRPDDMESRHLSALDVVRAVRNYNSMLSAGTSKFGDQEVQLDSNAMLVSVDEFNDVPIRIDGDKQVYLRDVGRAQDASRIQTALVRIDGKPQVYVPVYRSQGASSLSVVDSVKGALPLMQARAPAGVQLDVVMDQSEYVRHAIKSLVEEGVLGALLAAGMILLFLGDFRSTIIATMLIPLAVLAALAGLLMTGNTVNAMTLGGLALAIGPLVDNAIVVLENTHRHLQMGKSRVKAALDGAAEVAQPTLVATLATIIVLVPLAFLPGMGRFLFRPLALAVGFAMLVSLLLALTLVPTRCAAWLQPHDAHAARGLFGRFFAIIESIQEWLVLRYKGLLDWSLERRGLVLTAVTLLFFSALALLPLIGKDFFPLVDTGQLTVY